jgi:putative flavoprotein involved in K+ transport
VGATNRDGEFHEAIAVGAGPAGLSAAAALQGGDFETIVLESSGAVGARWRSRYEELRLNSWRVMSNLQGFKMPRSFGRYPGRDDFVTYLEGYAAHHRLRIHFDTKLIRVDRAEDLWRLSTSGQTFLARTVVIATGWDAVAVLPDWPGEASFVPELIHSSEVRSARAYRDRDVLVVGAGNSGIDIAGHLIAAGASVRLSMRTPPNLAKRDVLGLPGQPLLVFAADHLTRRVADLDFAIVQRLLFGDLAPFGLPRSSEGVYANFHRHLRNPAIDDGFIAALKKGRTWIVPEVQRLEGSEVVLADGARMKPDSVICVTGYRRGLETLVGHLGVLRPDGVPFAHRGAPEHSSAPGLYFAGTWGQFSGQIRLGPIHARRILRAATRRRASATRRDGSAPLAASDDQAR